MSVPAKKLQPGDVLADGHTVVRVHISEGKRSTSRARLGGYPYRSGWPIHADVVRVFVDGAPNFPRRFWPKQKVEVQRAG